MKDTDFRLLAVDLDGVVVRPLERFGENLWNVFIAEDLGVDPRALDRLFFRPYWSEIIVGRRDLRQTLGEVMPQVNPEVSVEQVLDYWFMSDARIDQAVVGELLAWKERNGGRLVALTNQERHRMAYLTENLGLGKIFESFVWSGEVGVTKSEVAFFAAALPRIGLDSPASLLFIDDDRGNVETARAAGWTAHHYTGIDDLRRVLGTGR